MRSVRSRLLFTEAARQKFGRTTGTSRPRSSRMIECTARLRDLTAQSRKFCSQFLVAHEATRHPRPHPPARIGKRRKVAVQHIKLEAAPRCPCSTRRLIVGDKDDRPARLARIAPPETAQPVAFCSHPSPLAPVDVTGKVCGRQPRPFGRSTSAVTEAGRPAAHPSRLAGLAQAIESRAARHLAVRPIAEPRAADHEVLALRFGLKSRDAAGSWIAPASE